MTEKSNAVDKMTVQQVKLNQYGYRVNEHVHAPYNKKEIHVHIHNVCYDSRNVNLHFN